MELKFNNVKVEIKPEDCELLKATARQDADAIKHREAFAQVIDRAWRQGVLEPDLIAGIFDRIPLGPGVDAKFPLDFYSPTTEGRYTAFCVPKEGAIPDRITEGDEIYVPTYKIANSISWSLDYARDARWDIVGRAVQAYTNGFTRKMNDDGWHIILKAASEHAVQQDTAASSGVFTKKLLTTLMTAIKRFTGGRNSRVTDVYLSPEGMADIRNFDYTVVDDLTLRNLLLTPENGVPQFFGVRLHEMEELGYGQEYQNYLLNTLGVVMPAGDEEFVVALDLQTRDSFVMPIREDMKTFDDPSLHRKMRAGVYGWIEVGFAALDTRRALLGSF